jgi:hypothetical protein
MEKKERPSLSKPILRQERIPAELVELSNRTLNRYGVR